MRYIYGRPFPEEGFTSPGSVFGGVKIGKSRLRKIVKKRKDADKVILTVHPNDVDGFTKAK